MPGPPELWEGQENFFLLTLHNTQEVVPRMLSFQKHMIILVMREVDAEWTFSGYGIYFTCFHSSCFQGSQPPHPWMLISQLILLIIMFSMIQFLYWRNFSKTWVISLLHGFRTSHATFWKIPEDQYHLAQFRDLQGNIGFLRSSKHC